MMTYEPSREQQGRFVHSVPFLFVPKSEGTMAAFPIVGVCCNPTATLPKNKDCHGELLQTKQGK